VRVVTGFPAAPDPPAEDPEDAWEALVRVVTGLPAVPDRPAEDPEDAWEALVRVVTGLPAVPDRPAGDGEDDPCDALVRVVTGAPGDVTGLPADPAEAACEALVRVLTAELLAVPDAPARREPLAPVRADLPTPEVGPAAAPGPLRRLAACPGPWWRTMWIVLRITWVFTSAGLRDATVVTGLGEGRSEKPARPAARTAANDPSIRPCVLRMFRAPPVGGRRPVCRAQPQRFSNRRQRFGKTDRVS
jgi:hypothetical protein